MKVLAIVAFNLKGAESDDYGTIRELLTREGLAESVKNNKDETFELPETTYLGVVDTPSPQELKERLSSGIQRLLKESNIGATYIVSIAKEWTLTMGRSKSRQASA